MSPEWASPLLSSTQQLRTHWSGVITSWYGIVIATYGVVWSLFLKAYLDNGYWENVAFGIIISSILLALWRPYARRIDNAMANLYPDLIIAEGALKVPPDNGTLGFLSRVGCLGDLLGHSSKLTYEQKVKAIDFLISHKRIGHRSHSYADLISAIVIILSNLLFIIAVKPDHSWLEPITYAISVVALFRIGNAWRKGQRNPKKNDITEAKRQ